MVLASSTEGLQYQGNVSRKISMKDGAFQGEGAGGSDCAPWPGTCELGKLRVAVEELCKG